MQELEILKQLGLEEQEAKTYIALLDLREATATKLSERANLGRVHMYQITNRLIEKGLISSVLKNNIKYFLPADPEILLKNLQEKEESLKKILPSLKARQKNKLEETKVELYKGREGINTIFKIWLKEEKNYYVLGGAAEACNIFELENKIFIKRAENLKIQGKILARKNDSFFMGNNEEYRYLSDDLISSTTMAMFGNKTVVFVWSDPYYAILIENKEIANNNISTFNYLWNIAEKPTKEDINKKLLN